jgi:hypothetical protein
MRCCHACQLRCYGSALLHTQPRHAQAVEEQDAAAAAGSSAPPGTTDSPQATLLLPEAKGQQAADNRGRSIQLGALRSDLQFFIHHTLCHACTSQRWPIPAHTPYAGSCTRNALDADTLSGEKVAFDHLGPTVGEHYRGQPRSAAAGASSGPQLACCVSSVINPALPLSAA